jgi:nucleotide-binding universal stress UspA family protein
MVYLRKILVPTDLSEFSLAAIDHAVSFGLLYSSKLYLLHVVDAPASVFGPDPKQERELEDHAGKQLEEFASKKLRTDMKFAFAVRRGSPADEITHFAEEEGIDLIVMATHGRTGLRHIVPGSVAEKVVRLSTVPVLTVKPHPVRENILKSEDIENELHIQ